MGERLGKGLIERFGERLYSMLSKTMGKSVGYKGSNYIRQDAVQKAVLKRGLVRGWQREHVGCWVRV
jgi:hypothetical protein